MNSGVIGVSTIMANLAVSRTWYCPSCATKNESNSSICRSCSRTPSGIVNIPTVSQSSQSSVENVGNGYVQNNHMTVYGNVMEEPEQTVQYPPAYYPASANQDMHPLVRMLLVSCNIMTWTGIFAVGVCSLFFLYIFIAGVHTVLTK